MDEQIQNAIMLGAVLGLGIQKTRALDDGKFQELKSTASDLLARLGVYEPLDELDLMREVDTEHEQAVLVVISLKNRLAMRIRSHATPYIGNWFEFALNTILISTTPEAIDELHDELKEQANRIDLPDNDFEDIIARLRAGSDGIFEILLKCASGENRKKSIFISYSHVDVEEAKLVMHHLMASNFNVIIDFENVTPGQRFSGFIRESVSNADVTFLIISKASLLSFYVGMEVIYSFYNELFSGKRFIAGYLDDNFLDPAFRIDAAKEIDTSIQKIDTADLDHQRKRLLDLRNHLGDILLKLTESKCIDLREEAFSRGINQIVTTIRTI